MPAYYQLETPSLYQLLLFTDNCEPSAIPSSPTKYNMFRNSRSTCSMMTDSDSPEIISELNSSASSYELIKHEKY